MMQKKAKIVLVGSGYGYQYTKWIEDNKDDAVLAGIVDPFFTSVHSSTADVAATVYRSMEDFYRVDNADLAVIATPINLHKEQCLYALSKGSHVLCEKPVAGSLADAEEMVRAYEKYGKIFAVGFQWSFNKTILAIKEDILSGRYGKILSMKTLVLWPRSLTYFARSWTGKRYASDGAAIMDSVASNATAHYLHNLLFLSGGSLNRAAGVKSVNAFIYKANDVETYDTAEIKVVTQSDIPLYYYASHSVEHSTGPLFECEFENGRVTYDNHEAVGVLYNGEIKKYGVIDDPGAGLRTVLHKLKNDGIVIPCDIVTACPHMEVMEQINQKLDDAIEFPEKRKKHRVCDGEEFVYVEGLDSLMLDHYENLTFEKMSMER